MRLLRRLMFARVGPDLFAASTIQAILTAIGVFTFVAGAMYLPYIRPSRVEMFVLLLLLAAVALLCHIAGQFAVLIERLPARPGTSSDHKSSI